MKSWIVKELFANGKRFLQGKITKKEFLKRQGELDIIVYSQLPLQFAKYTAPEKGCNSDRRKVF